MKKLYLIIFLFINLTFASAHDKVILPGAENTDEYLPLLKNKRIGVLTNHTGMVGNEHLVDMLHRLDYNVVCIFSPEHGFRGNADAGEHVKSAVDEKTGIPIKSLYDGNTGKPDKNAMASIDILVFDLQDVGLRYYTYLTTMVRMMDACAENGIKMIILDRPNPNGHYVDGPILNMKYKSAVGWLPVPIVHGMTLGEMAGMVNGEKWLPEGRTCNINVIKCKNYTHASLYKLPIPPSPNLQNMRSIYLYPSLCFFEATPVSLGRGTEFPFQVYGHPLMKDHSFQFTPQSMTGAKKPPLLNQLCFGSDLRKDPSDKQVWQNGVDLDYLIDAYKTLNMGSKFFTSFLEKLVGVDYVRTMILEGKTAAEIKAMWRKDIQDFKKQRAPYLLYPAK